MRRSVIVSASLVCVSLLLAGPLRADDGKIKSAIEAQYGKIVQGYKAKDAAVFERMTTSDFAWKGRKGQVVSRDKIFKSIERSIARVESFDDIKTDLGPVTVTGDQAAANYTLRLIATIRGADGLAHKLDTNRVSLDTWIKQGNDWKLKMVEIHARTMALDGKPVKRRPPPPAAGTAPKPAPAPKP